MAIYNLKVQKLARTIRSDQSFLDPDDSFVMDFGMSGGLNKLLFVIWGQVDPVLTVYRWYSGKVIATLGDCGITRAAFEPATDTLLAISEHTITMFAFVQDSFKKSTVFEANTVRLPFVYVCNLQPQNVADQVKE